MAKKLYNPNIFNSAVFNTLAPVVATRLFNRNVFGYPTFNTGETPVPFTGTPFGKILRAAAALSTSITVREQ